MPIEPATAIGSAPIVFGWSTITSTRPWPSSRVNSSSSLVWSWGRGLSRTLRPAVSSAQAWWDCLPTSSPHQMSKPVFSSMTITILPSNVTVAMVGDASVAGTHVTKRPELRPCPYQRSSGATRPGDNTPRIMCETGAVSHAGPGDPNPLRLGPPER